MTHAALVPGSWRCELLARWARAGALTLEDLARLVAETDPHRTGLAELLLEDATAARWLRELSPGRYALGPDAPELLELPPAPAPPAPAPATAGQLSLLEGL